MKINLGNIFMLMFKLRSAKLQRFFREPQKTFGVCSRVWLGNPKRNLGFLK